MKKSQIRDKKGGGGGFRRKSRKDERHCRGDTKPCQRSWKSRETRPWENDGETMNRPTLVCYVSRNRSQRKKKILRKAKRKGLGALGSK
jgi:hypothetical protein